MSRRSYPQITPPKSLIPGSAPEAPAVHTPDPVLREAIDIIEVEGKWQVRVITYHDEICASEVVFESFSGPEAANRYTQLAMRKSFLARSGQPHPEGDQILP